MLTQLFTSWSKGIFGRARPYTDHGPRDFNFFKFSPSENFKSLPSGHVSSAFALMTVIAKQYDHWYGEIPAYTFAVSVAFQRMNSRNHWTSDTIVGGALGYWVGSTLAQKQRRPAKGVSLNFYPMGNRLGSWRSSEFSTACETAAFSCNSVWVRILAHSTKKEQHVKSYFYSNPFILVALSLSACHSGYERKVTEQDVPPAVLQTFEAAYPNAEVRSYAEETEGDEKLYEISFTNEGKRIDVAYANDGKLLELEETIDPADLPQVAHGEIKNVFKDAAIKRAERFVKGERTGYEVKLDVPENGASKRYELVFDPDGKLLKKKAEPEEDEE